MKTGKTIVQLAQEIERQGNSKRDFIVDTKALHMNPTQGLDEANHSIELEVGDQLAFGINSIGHRQIGEHVGVPAKYYDRMLKESPALLAHNVNHWFGAEPGQRMVRTLDGNATAFLSDRYRPLENVDLAEAVIPILHDLKIEVISCEITESRLYLKGVDQRVVRTINARRQVDGQLVTADDVCPSICISNSEVGMGALSIEVGMFTHACKNMMLFRESSLRKYHVGGKHEAFGDQLRELMSDQTRKVTDAATWLQVRDVVRGAFDEQRFTANIAGVQEMTQQKLIGDPVKAIELTARRLNLAEGEQKSVLRHLIEGGDLSRYGVFNSITRAAEDIPSYDRATELERAGGMVLALAANDWKAIAEAA
jgi:hypothetical protein